MYVMLFGQEELVAELGAAFSCAKCQIANKTIEPSANYIAGWLETPGNHKRLLVHAGATAQKAVEFILKGRSQDSRGLAQSR